LFVYLRRSRVDSLVNVKNSAAIRVFLINGYRCILWGFERLIESRQPAMRVVGSAASGAEALEQIDDAAPDLILLDVDLGKEEVTATITKLKARSPAKILVLTGLRNGSLPNRAMLAGASGVVRKESPAESILTAIEKVHQGKQWLDPVTKGRILSEVRGEGVTQAPGFEQTKIRSLTFREREIVALATNHPRASATTLAEMLNITEHTFRNHLTSIYEKLNVSGRLTMSAFAYKHGLTSAPPTGQGDNRSGNRRRGH